MELAKVFRVFIGIKVSFILLSIIKFPYIYELQSLMKKSLSSQELSLAETKVKELAVLRH